MFASLLHVRGGVSAVVYPRSSGGSSSPRPWRCFPTRSHSTRERIGSSPRPWRCFLEVAEGSDAEPPSSPRPWRCFQDRRGAFRPPAVFSTSVEVFPTRTHTSTMFASLLHVRGGVSTVGGGARLDCQSSPRPWRCFQAPKRPNRAAGVFSTSVEVFLLTSVPIHVLSRLLHVRGGVSIELGTSLNPPLSSPRPWRCFYRTRVCRRSGDVFSTSVEVFPCDFLEVDLMLMSSPRPWRCFSGKLGTSGSDGVFSTSVEVFPTPK